MRARDRAKQRRAVLVIDHYVPKPDQDAGSRSIFAWMRILVEGGLAVKFWPANLWYDPDYTPRLQQMGIEVFYGREYANHFARWVKDHGKHLDYILLSRPHISVDYIMSLQKFATAKIMYYGHDVHHLRIREEMRIKSGDASLAKDERFWKKLEHRLWGSVDVIYYPSESETAYVQRWLLEQRVKAQARTIPLLCFDGFRDEVASGLAQRKGIILVGGFAHSPNVDAAVWFVREVFPLTEAKLPDVHLYIVGSNPPPEIRALSSANVTVTGYITDPVLENYYQRVRVAVVPLRYGAGLKGKVIEAMRFGVPLVTTRTGIQGLEDCEGAVAVANDSETFAALVLQLITDDALWLSQAQRAVDAVKAKFSVASLREALALDFELK